MNLSCDKSVIAAIVCYCIRQIFTKFFAEVDAGVEGLDGEVDGAVDVPGKNQPVEPPTSPQPRPSPASLGGSGRVSKGALGFCVQTRLLS